MKTAQSVCRLLLFGLLIGVSAACTMPAAGPSPTATPASLAQEPSSASRVAAPTTVEPTEPPAATVTSVAELAEPTNVPPPASESAPPTPDAVVTGQLADELWVTGPPVFAIGSCMEAPEKVDLPAATWEAFLDVGHVCLWGFPENEDIRYEIYDPEGTRAAEGTIQAATFFEGPAVADVMIQLEGQPSGDWTVYATSPSAQLEVKVWAEKSSWPKLEAVASHDITALTAGDKVTLRGSGMPPEAAVPFGIYFVEEDPAKGTHYQLVYDAALQVDEAGEFTEVLEVEDSDPPGAYCAVVPLQPYYIPSTGPAFDGAMTCFSVAQP